MTAVELVDYAPGIGTGWLFQNLPPALRSMTCLSNTEDSDAGTAQSMQCASHGGGHRAWVLDADPPLEIGRKVPDHKHILLDVAKGKKMCFHPMCLYSMYSEFLGEFKSGQKLALFSEPKISFPSLSTICPRWPPP